MVLRVIHHKVNLHITIILCVYFLKLCIFIWYKLKLKKNNLKSAKKNMIYSFAQCNSSVCACLCVFFLDKNSVFFFFFF